MAEQIALDPNFRRMAETMGGQMTGAGAAPSRTVSHRGVRMCSLGVSSICWRSFNSCRFVSHTCERASAVSQGPPAVDPAQYMQAMQGMMQNPEFMAMAERLGSQMMRVRSAACPTNTRVARGDQLKREYRRQ